MALYHEVGSLYPIAALLHDKIAQSGKTQKELARLMGYDNPNILSMLKHGESKVPLDRVPVIAKVLEIDAAHLFRLALMQYWRDWQGVVDAVVGGVVTANEMELLRALRQATRDRDPAFHPEKIAAAVAVLAAPATSGSL